MSTKPSKITLVDIANELGLSPATVSLALRDKPVVAEKTRQLVHEKVREMGYVYNRSAAQLRTQRSRSIGLIVPNLVNPFFAELTNKVEEIVDSEGCSLIVAGTSENLERQNRVLRSMQEYGVDGVLICPVPNTRPKHLRPLLKNHLPMVLYTRPIKGLAANYVGANNAAGISMATRYLIDRGHTRIAFVGGRGVSMTRAERFRGFKEACDQAGIEVISDFCVSVETSIKAGYSAIGPLLDRSDPPTAAVCYNDVLAFGVILGLWAMQRTPGDDFAVTGFDDIANAAIWSPPLTTVACPPQQIAQTAVELIVSRIGHPRKNHKKTILPPKLMARKSCGE